MNDREGPQATADYSRNWLIVFATLMLVAAASFFLHLLIGVDAAALTIDIALAALALFALVDGAWRVIGNEGFLGPGWGFDRALAFVQVLLALGVLMSFVV